MVFKFGLGGIIRLLRFEARAKRVAGKYQTADNGYLMAFATRIDKQWKASYGGSPFFP